MLMKHNEHGLKDAVGAEIEEMKKNGWVEYGYEAFYADVAKKRGLADNAKQPETAQGESTTPTVKRRGRKPRGE